MQRVRPGPPSETRGRGRLGPPSGGPSWQAGRCLEWSQASIRQMLPPRITFGDSSRCPPPGSPSGIRAARTVQPSSNREQPDKSTSTSIVTGLAPACIEGLLVRVHHTTPLRHWELFLWRPRTFPRLRRKVWWYGGPMAITATDRRVARWPARLLWEQFQSGRWGRSTCMQLEDLAFFAATLFGLIHSGGVKTCILYTTSLDSPSMAT